jgi:hypothetical protein
LVIFEISKRTGFTLTLPLGKNLKWYNYSGHSEKYSGSRTKEAIEALPSTLIFTRKGLGTGDK